MDVIENSLEPSLADFLDRPLFCFLGQISSDGAPRLSPLWYLWEDNRLWIIADTVGKSYASRVKQHPETAVAIVDFDVHTGRVEHVGMRGRAVLSPLNMDRVSRLLRRYLGENTDTWDDRFANLDAERWSFIEFSPETVVARDQSFSPSFDCR
ncbi:pyridoxamine 5'-phosphate oxidase family protein [Halovenus rubra]|uniref:Pyridoxamine 5'-phosphate oxidase family protein n=2 Tax=Halovenus rubra TaxID=869890 RepID=A0ACC7E2H0_9EURY|nr:pyridoxamine 5'-phosphate oxidase family protein [Halovenus rubra]